MLTKTWTDKEREVLIDEVHKRPELYNNAHPEFKNKERRAQAFDDIAHLIASVSENPEQSVDGRTVSAQWKILKDSFNRTRKAAANSKTYNVPVWRFYRQMEFLVPYTTRYDHFTSSPTPAPPVNSLPNSSSTHYSDTSGDLDDDDVDDVRSKSSSNHDDHFVLQSPEQKVVLNSGQSSSHGDERHIEVHTPNGSHEVHGPHFLAASSSFHYKDRFNHDPEDFSLSSITPTTHISNHILLSTIDQPRKRPHQEICIPTTALVSHGSASASSTNSSSASVPFTTTGNLEDYVVDVVKRRVFDSREDDFDLFGRLVASAVREVAHFDQKMFLEMRREINEVVYKFEKKRFG
ncbi:unnamed protein product [Bursaphelenchus xylophilus]|uniref:(pine wood nematode) hypothetical protein n=1 Tax=Bursaphelenchus xylophilus TaxID=6326 RepID=A0A1I7S4S9_BURXY|nr:unnamed protein product [Bursaphelenchus xylophilus]CAG9117352.1 unnamed protein product [Bursaphelenchus xylophilus]